MRRYDDGAWLLRSWRTVRSSHPPTHQLPTHSTIHPPANCPPPIHSPTHRQLPAQPLTHPSPSSPLAVNVTDIHPSSNGYSQVGRAVCPSHPAPPRPSNHSLYPLGILERSSHNPPIHLPRPPPTSTPRGTLDNLRSRFGPRGAWSEERGDQRACGKTGRQLSGRTGSQWSKGCWRAKRGRTEVVYEAW